MPAKAMAARFGSAVFVKIEIQHAAFSLHGIRAQTGCVIARLDLAR
ncbi:MAG: hypothetical protein Q7U78_14360 [Gallionella sp.]|nr:hypothetical protein [Gallionella sp.]